MGESAYEHTAREERRPDTLGRLAHRAPMLNPAGKRASSPTDESSQKRSELEQMVSLTVSIHDEKEGCLERRSLQTPARLARLWREEKLVDITIHCGTESIPCHRIVLAAASEYFLALFDSSNFRDSSSPDCYLCESGISPAVLRHVLDWLYDGSVRVSRQDLEEIGAAASFLQVGSLLRVVESKMILEMDRSTCLSSWCFADRYSLEKLANEAASAAALHFMWLQQHEDGVSLAALPLSLMSELLMKDELRARSEEDVLRVALEWAKAQQPKLPDTDLVLIFQQVRFELLPTSMNSVILNEPMLQGTACREMLLRSFMLATYGQQRHVRFPDTAAGARELGFSADRAKVEGLPASEIYELCKVLSPGYEANGAPAVTSWGSFCRLYSSRPSYSGPAYYQQHAPTYTFELPWENDPSKRQRIELDQVRLLVWSDANLINLRRRFGDNTLARQDIAYRDSDRPASA